MHRKLSDTRAATPAAIQPGEGMFHCVGDWTLDGIAALEQRLAQTPWPAGDVALDGSGIEACDTTGAMLLADTLDGLRRAGRQARLTGLQPEFQALLDLVVERRKEALHAAAPPRRRLPPLAQLGRQVLIRLTRMQGLLAFLGETSVVLARSLLQPTRIRWRALFANIERAGLDAIPIVGLLSFLIGLVIAYQGSNQLQTYGANIYIVELVCLIMVRELAPLLTAIIVAGRTGSAFTAQIGTMQVTEEIDALRIIGINPIAMLVVPKLLGLCIALPLLSLLADAASICGGMVVARSMLDINFVDFIQRIPRAVTPFSFLFGLGKAPVFALVIALVGCYQGFQVRGGADSVGRQTTESVMQAIFLVIVIDALFAVLIGAKGIQR